MSNMRERPAVLGAFADRLEELRLRAGSPSYAELAKLSPWLRRSTISDVLRGRSNPSLDFVVAFVAACNSYSKSKTPPPTAGPADVDSWRQAWLHVQRELSMLRRPNRTQAPSAESRNTTDTVGPVPRQLPPAPYPFVGRRPYLEALNGLVDPAEGEGRAATTRLVVDGPAGVGKTALVVYWAYQVRDHFPGGDLFIDLRGYGQKGPPFSGAEALRVLLQTLDVPVTQFADDPDQLSMLWRSVLAERRLLVVLDNAESSTQVRPLLPGAGKSTVVVTSRRRLSGLLVRDGVEAFSLAPMEPSESRDLFQSVTRAQVRADGETVEQLAELCDHSPLAIRILAERIVGGGYAPEQAMSELASANPLTALATSDGDPTGAVRNVLSWSYQALPDSTARMFRLLSLHPGIDVSAGAASALAEVPSQMGQQALAELANMNLLSEIASSRYRMHDLLGYLSVEMLEAHETAAEQVEAKLRLALWYLHSAAAVQQIMRPGRRSVLRDPAPGWLEAARLAGYDEALSWCEAERDNLVGVVREALENQWFDICWQLPTMLLGYFNLRKVWREWTACFDLALSAARELGDRYAEANCANALGIAYRELGYGDAALEYLSNAARLFHDLGVVEGECYALNNIANIFSSDPGRAVAVLRQALDVTRSGDYRFAKLTVLHNLGEAYLKLGAHVGALTCARQCLNASEDANDREGVGLALSTLGEIYARQRRWDEAHRLLRAAIDAQEEIGDLRGKAVAVFRLGRVLAGAGDTSAASDCLRHARQQLELLDDPHAAEVRAFQRRL